MAIYSAYLDSVRVMSRESGFPFAIANGDLVSDPDLYFVEGGEIHQRPSMRIERSGARFAGVPRGAEVFVDGVLMGVCEDGLVELEIPAPGRYAVRIELFPFQPYKEVLYES
ncbi:hypothetical protein [Achromobacter marplatensis]|uniref:hypothetical protein n=1 Tax=Achromobacter marplatensis TaxID=470868 RepID=UPI003C734D71